MFSLRYTFNKGKKGGPFGLYQFIYDEAPVSTKPIFAYRDTRPMLDLGLFVDEEKEVTNSSILFSGQFVKVFISTGL